MFVFVCANDCKGKANVSSVSPREIKEAAMPHYRCLSVTAGGEARLFLPGKRGQAPLSTPKHPPSRITHSKNGRFLYDHEEYG